MDDFIKAILTDLFTEEEFQLLSHVTPNSINVDELKKTGTVDVTEIEKDGYVVKEVAYTSNEGNVSFTKTMAYMKQDEKQMKLYELQEQLEQQLSLDTAEGYTKAAEIKKQIEELQNPA